MEKKLLILCTGNSCRSQMAEGYFKHFNPGNWEIYSAGIETHGLNPKAVKVMAEDGIDISSQQSENVEQYLDEGITHLITVCDHANENCPFIPGEFERIHHSFQDPAKARGSEEEVLDEFRRVRNEIKEYAKTFFEKPSD